MRAERTPSSFHFCSWGLAAAAALSAGFATVVELTGRRDDMQAWLPWVQVAGLVVAALTAAALLRRLERRNAELAQANRTIAAHSAGLEESVRTRTDKLEQARHETLQKLALASEFRDDETRKHTERVGRMAAEVAHGLGASDVYVSRIRRAAPLHDVGKLALPDTILLKPGKLTRDEYATMQLHADVGRHILSGSSSEILQMGATIAGSHHERWDGAGYPGRLVGTEIPLSGRITAVVDVFDALTHARPYKEAWPLERALQEIREGSGSQFDPLVVESFLSLDHAAFAGEVILHTWDEGPGSMHVAWCAAAA